MSLRHLIKYSCSCKTIASRCLTSDRIRQLDTCVDFAFTYRWLLRILAKGMTKFALVLRGPKGTAVIAARFPPFPPSLLRSPPSLLLPTLSTPSTLPAVFAVAVLLAVLNIIPCHCYRLLHPPCRSGNEIVVNPSSSLYNLYINLNTIWLCIYIYIYMLFQVIQPDLHGNSTIVHSIPPLGYTYI